MEDGFRFFFYSNEGSPRELGAPVSRPAVAGFFDPGVQSLVTNPLAKLMRRLAS